MAVSSDPEEDQRQGSAGTVFVVDDEEPMRNALRRVLVQAGFTVQTFTDATHFLDAHPAMRPCCVVLDMRMPGMTGLELQHELRSRGITFPVIFLTGAGTVAQAVTAMHAGAVDFLEKPVENEELVARVRTAIAIDRQTLEQTSEREELTRLLGSLTRREKEVLLLLSRGQSNKMVARNLSLSPRTVEGYRARIMEKLNARSLAELVHMVEQGGDLLDSRARAGPAEPA